MKTLLAAATTLCLLAQVAHAQDDDAPSPEAVERIMTMLSEMRCEMSPDDIEVEDEGGYDLDDVICEDQGQMDIKLDADFNEVSRRLE
ncbi:PepSY domain-containing protein [Roseivivax isoporae]|uniref:PepSY domain-containing protein n=1 Tax=Roseivivax isoporae LMG 25204 TaxID=1449351 RepID=X7F9X5_9RHOB|nr:PepSY domain-containing protein [Roseivivax isoporae]ETX29585.1 hypothetical protein RISW2_22125 [Roseivivax isoporae LMG 25204]